jgi:2,4-dienoyl-CoA reductase-like NADH-dependent reductase (Old Yellow Enzyme family)
MSTAAPPDVPQDRVMILNRSTEALFRPFQLKGLTLANRIVMAPMTRSHSPGGVPGADVAAYYRRRAEGGVGLIITEGTYVDHPAAGFDPNVPRFYGEQAVSTPGVGWRRVAEQVHAAGGLIFPQLWHVGMVVSPGLQPRQGIRPIGPSGFSKPDEKTGEPERSGHRMTQADIDAVIDAFAKGARDAQAAGFDGVELHGAHGYLLDQFFWERTNRRIDQYGGDLGSRARFAADIIQEVRNKVGPDFPVVLRFSQWKLQDFEAKLAPTPEELERFLRPLVDAGVDALHCSTRRFWEPEFAGSDLNLAGWTKKLTGKPAITVGSVTLDQDLMTSFGGTGTAGVANIDNLLERLDRDEFDLVAIGRSLIVNPAWPGIVRRGALNELLPFDRAVLSELV